MSYFERCKRAVVLFVIGGTMLYSAGFTEKKFDVETGMVRFEINGAGQLAENVTISIKGEGKLRFKNWGIDALVEEYYEERTTGILKNINKMHICEKFENRQRFDVDFSNEKILERPMPKGNFKDYYLKNMVKTGQETIAGYTCDVWEGFGMKKCLYKDIPLLVEYYILGVYYQKKAVEVKFNIEPDPSRCALPDFPVEKFALFKTNIKTKSIKAPKEFSARLLDVSKEMHHYLKENHLSEDELPEHQKKRYFDKLGQYIFEKEKKFLPKMLSTMKETRLCLQQVESTNEANACILDLINLKKQVTEDKDNYIVSWDKETRAKTMDEFDETIAFLESKMKCIRTSHTLSDLAHCMKKQQ